MPRILVITLVLVGLIALLAADLVAAESYPCWRGVNGSGSNSTGVATVDDVKQAKLVWVSEDVIPASGFDITSVTMTGGLMNPVLADGRLYLTYWLPSGDTPQADWQEMASSKRQKRAFPTDKDARRRWLVAADDVVHCFDAKTGKTLWKKIFTGQAVNSNGRPQGMKTGPHMTPCVADGRVYSAGSLMALMCQDAKTGEVIWHNPVPAGWQQTIDDAKAQKKQLSSGRDLCNVHLHVVDGILVVPNGTGRGLTGYDAKTGNQVWDIPGAAVTQGLGIGPIRWHTGGKTYLIVGLSCVDPRSGKVLWKLDDHDGMKPNRNFTPAVEGDMLVVPLGHDQDNLLAGFAISPKAVKHIWSATAFRKANRVVAIGSSPMIMDGRIYAHACHTKTVGGRAKGARGGKHGMVMLDVKTGTVIAEAEFGTKFNQVWDSTIGGDGLAFNCPVRVPRGLTVFKSDGQQIKNIGTLEPDQKYGWCTTGVYADGRVYFRRWNNLVCYDLRR